MYLTAIVLLLWFLRLVLHTKVLSHDPAPEGPLSVLYQKCTHCPVQISRCTCLPPSLTKSHLQFFSFCSSCLFFFQCLSLQSFPRPPSHNLLKTFPPCGSWTLSPTHSTTLPPWQTAQVSIYYKMPTIPGRGMSYLGVLWHVVQIAQLIMHVKCNNSNMGLKRAITLNQAKQSNRKI